MKNKIIFVSSQKADYNNFILIKKILKKKFNLKHFHYNYKFSKKIFSNKKKTNKYLKKNLKYTFNKSKLIITGTSNYYLEKQVWMHCNENSLKCLTILDSWVNLKRRFNSMILPNYIIMPNGKYSNSFLKLIKKKTKIFFTGNFFLNYIYNYKFNKKKKNILFLTSKRNNNEDYNFIKVLSNHIKDKKIYIKIHPKEIERPWLKKLNLLINSKKNIKISKGSLVQNLSKCHYVFGIYSMALLSAMLAKKRVITKLPNSNKKEYLYYILKKYAFKFDQTQIKNNFSKKKSKISNLKKIYEDPKIKLIKIIDDICNSD